MENYDNVKDEIKVVQNGTSADNPQKPNSRLTIVAFCAVFVLGCFLSFIVGTYSEPFFGGSKSGGSSYSEDYEDYSSTEEYVYVTESGSRYHSDPDCSNMTSPSKISIEEAQERGYSPCKKCY